MKLTLLLILVSVVNISASVYSQEFKANLSLKDATVKEVLGEIEKTSKFKFLYRNDIVDVQRKISIDSRNEDLNTVLGKIFDLSLISYRVFEDNTIVITASTKVQTSVTGNIKDKTGSLPGVSVMIKGTSHGTITDIDGNFSLTVPDANAVLIISFIGYKKQEISLNGKTHVEVLLEEDAINIGDVVVTALGIKREKKSLGYSVQDVKSEDLRNGGNADVVSSLQNKVAGVHINESGGGAGSSSRVEIRGASSLAGNNNPLWVIDGVPFANDQNSTASIWGGKEPAGSAYDVNPDDIETISVLKGPNAAALYGSRAGNGVILVTTKKGSRNKGLGIEYSTNVSFSNAAYMLDLQDQYGQGSNGVYDKNSAYSWGPKMEGQMLPSWTGETVPYTAQTNRIKDFCRTGISQMHNLALATGGEHGSFRTSVGKSRDNGIFDGNQVDRSNFDIKADYDVNKWLNVDAKVSYILTKGQKRPEMGYYSYMSYFNTMPMNIRNSDLDPGYTINSTGNHVEKLYISPNANYRNPYFLQNQISNSDERNRAFGYLATNIKIMDDLKLRLRYGLDYYRENLETRYLYADNANPNHPNYETGENFFSEENYEFLLSYNKNLNADFSLSLNAGGNKMYRHSKGLTSNSGRFPDEVAGFLGYGTSITSTESIKEEEVQSLYGSGQIGFKNYVYLDVTARNDWSSTLPVKNNSYFYPSVSLSLILSDMFKMPGFVNYAKVRGSWAQVGKATKPYDLNQAYTVTQGDFKLLNGNTASALVNKDLKPEISSSSELGLDLKFLNNRLGFDFTYYNAQTKNQILRVPTDQSTGYKEKLINAGLITNKGIELLMTTRPVKLDKFTLDVDFNFSKNESFVKELDNTLKEFELGSINNGVKVVATEGRKLGDIIGKKFNRDNNGNLIVDSKGLPTRTSANFVLGNYQADWTGSVALKANYKGIYLSALVSVQKGGSIYSATENAATASGNAKRTTDMNRMARFVEGVTSTGAVNNELVSAQEYWNAVAQIDEAFIYSASHMKLKELAMGYNLPKSLLTKIPGAFLQSARFSVFGRNLMYFYKHTPGTVPDAGAYNTSLAAQAFDFSPVPATRSYGFSLNLGF